MSSEYYDQENNTPDDSFRGELWGVGPDGVGEAEFVRPGPDTTDQGPDTQVDIDETSFYQTPGPDSTGSYPAYGDPTSPASSWPL